MKRFIISFALLLALGAFFYLKPNGKQVHDLVKTHVEPISSLINENGMTVKTRVDSLKGYTPVSIIPNTFSDYVLNYALKPATAKVINYDGANYGYQSGHVGVLEIPVPSNGLQQCADALIRIRAEYLWARGLQNQIGFNFTSGHYCSWEKYAQGYRPKIEGNKVTFSKTVKKNTSKDSFYRYLNLVYTYAGTYSLSEELTTIIDLQNVQIGDMVVYPGFPGHIMMIANIIESENGERYFLFFQGNTPAQSVHIIKNTDDLSVSPWYSLEGKSSLDTPLYTFSSFKIVRFK